MAAPGLRPFHRLSKTGVFASAMSGQPAAALGWRAKLSHKPAIDSWRFHRIKHVAYGLMDVVALRAPECSDVKARVAGCDPYQRGNCSALGT